MRRLLLAASPIVATAAMFLVAHGCGGSGDRSGLPPPPNLDLPPDVESALPHTEAGLPVLMSLTADMPPGLALALAYDAKNDDPVARWGSCLGRVGACYRTNGGWLGGCVDSIPTCDDPNGGRGCCPSACIKAFKDALAANGNDEDKAVEASFLAGGCIPNFVPPPAPVQP
jgi:hypothetical protein